MNLPPPGPRGGDDFDSLVRYCMAATGYVREVVEAMIGFAAQQGDVELVPDDGKPSGLRVVPLPRLVRAYRRRKRRRGRP